MIKSDKTKMFVIGCYRCGEINFVHYKGDKPPRKGRIQCCECKRYIKFDRD